MYGDTYVSTSVYQYVVFPPRVLCGVTRWRLSRARSWSLGGIPDGPPDGGKEKRAVRGDGGEGGHDPTSIRRSSLGRSGSMPLRYFVILQRRGTLWTKGSQPTWRESKLDLFPVLYVDRETPSRREAA